VSARTTTTLRTLGSSDLANMQPTLDEAARTTGVTLALTPTTSLTGTQTIVSGKADGHYDTAWLATNRYLTMSPGG